MRTRFCRTKRTNANIRTNDRQSYTHHGHGRKFSTQGQRHPNAITRNAHDNNHPGHSDPITTMGTNHNQRGSRNRAKFNQLPRHSFAEPLFKVRGITGNLRKTTHTNPRTGHKSRQHNWITPKNNHTPKTRHLTNGSQARPDSRHMHRKGRRENTFSPQGRTKSRRHRARHKTNPQGTPNAPQ